MANFNRGFGELLEFMIGETDRNHVAKEFVRNVLELKISDEALDEIGPGVRTRFRKAMNHRANRIINPYHVAEILGALGIKADKFFPMRYPLLSQWPAGYRTEVFIGGHTATKIKNVAVDVELQAVGLGDTLAFGDLIRFFQHAVDGSVRFELSPAKHDFQAARTQIDASLKRKNIGAVVSLGSDVVNSASAALAERILEPSYFDQEEKSVNMARTGQEKKDAKLPLIFRWSEHSMIRLTPKNVPDILSDINSVKDFKEGLWYRDQLIGNKPPFPRDRRSHAQQMSGENSNRDCGLVLLDVRALPWKFVLAGHGSDGTQAAVHALRDQGLIHTRLADPSDESLGKDRACVVVITKRESGKLFRHVIDDVSVAESEKWILVP